MWGRYHQERSSQLITFRNQIFPVKNLNLPSSSLIGLVAESPVVKTRQFLNLLSSHLRFWVSSNLLSSQRPIFRLPKNPVTPPHVQGTGNRSSIVCDRYGILSCCQFYARYLMKMTIFFTCFRHSIEWRKSTGKGTHWRIELINLLEMLTPHRPCEKGWQIHTMSRWNSAHGICSWKHKNWAAHSSGSYKMLDLWDWLHQTLQKPPLKIPQEACLECHFTHSHTASCETLRLFSGQSILAENAVMKHFVSVSGDHASNNLVWGLILWRGEQ